MSKRRSAVYVIHSDIIGHDLVFRHYTNTVVVAKHPETKTKPSKQDKSSKRKNEIN